MGSAASRAAPAVGAALRKATPLGAGVVGVAGVMWMPAVQCAGGDMGMPDVDAGLEEEEEAVGVEILDFAEMAREKTIEVSHSDGMTAVVSVPFTKLEDVDGVATSRPTFLLQHLLMLGGSNGNQLQTTIINQLDEKSAVTVTAISHAPGTLLFMPNVSMALAPGVMAKYQCFFTNPNGEPSIDAGQATVSAKGSDYALGVSATRGDRMGGDSFQVDYFQSVHPSLALGGFTQVGVAKGGYLAPSGAVSWGLNGSWQSTDMAHAIVASYNSAKSDVSAVYNRQVTEKLRMSAKWSRSEGEGDVISVGAEQPLRIERMLGNAPYTTLTGQLDVRGLAADASAVPHAVVKASLDHMTLHGMGAFTLSAQFDAYRKEYSFGGQFRLSA